MSGTPVISDYRDAMRRRHLAASTIYARSCTVRRWIEFADDWTTADGDDFERWLDSLSLGARARYTTISHVHAFYGWARRRRLVVDDPTELIERPRLPRRLPRPARMADVTTAIETAEPWIAAALSMMVDGGLRCCEVAGVEWHDVDLDAGTMFVTGKGGHDRMIGLPARLVGHLAALDGFHGPVIGRRITPTRVSQIVNAYLRSVGVRATAHQLRHLYATRMLAATGDITAVQQALGHASIASTQIYAAINPVTALDAARRLVA